MAPLTPEEIAERTKLLADIADRIMLLCAAWATTLSFEILREGETWLRKLQQIAATMPREYERARWALAPVCWIRRFRRSPSRRSPSVCNSVSYPLLHQITGTLK